jgi:hypothetical protein
MRLLLLISLTLLSFYGWSQSLEISQNYIDYQYSNGDVSVTNISDEAVQISMIIEARCLSDLDEPWFQACLQVCQDWSDETYIQYVNPPVTLNPGASNEYLSFHVDDYADGILEPMIWRQYFYVIGSPSDNVWIEISLGGGTCPDSNMIVGVEDKVKSEHTVFPNPTAGSIAINSTSNQPFYYQLVDLRGQVVFESDVLLGGETSLDLTGVPTGLYLGRWVGLSGEVMSTGRLIIE